MATASLAYLEDAAQEALERQEASPIIPADTHTKGLSKLSCWSDQTKRLEFSSPFA